MEKFKKWLLESNRYKHVLGGTLYAFLFMIFSTAICEETLFCAFVTIASVLGAACALEFKDWQWCKCFDIIDLLLTVVGGLFAIVLYLFMLWIKLA